MAMRYGFESTSVDEEYEGLFYTKNIELTVSLREVDREYYVHREYLVNYSDVTDQYIIVYWKPPGALNWVEKFTTEKLSGNNLDFVTKGYFDTEDEDLSGIQLKFYIFGRSGDCWSSIETSLDRVVKGGVYGTQLTLILNLPDIPRYLEQKQAAILPGFLHLRCEYVNSPAKDRFGIIMWPEERGSHETLREKYCSELYKVNIANRLDKLINPYLILFRDRGDLQTHRYYYSTESQITNGDWDRVMKIVISKRNTTEKKGFTLFTINNMIRKPAQLLHVYGALNGRILGDIMMAIRVSQFGNLKTFPDYMRMGVKIIRVYAVDFSNSNWNGLTHGKPLHKNAGLDLSPYEEGLEMVGKTMAELCEGESVFYSFGDDGTDMVTTFGTGNHVRTLSIIYSDALCSILFNNMKLNEHEDSRVGDQYTNSTTAYNYSPKNQPGSSRGFLNCMPQKCKPLPVSKRSKRLSPFLEELNELLGTRPINSLEYFTAFIFTDGGFTDLEKASKVMAQLSAKGMSVIFIGIGNGDLSFLTRLDKNSTGSWRKNTHVVHFRSNLQWQSSFSYYKVKPKSDEIFIKELLTVIRDQSVAYLRLKHP